MKVVDHSTFLRCTQELSEILTSGYVVGLRIRNFTPGFYFTTVDPAWERSYIAQRKALFDPIVAWSVMNTGRARWSEINILGVPSGSTRVMREAAAIGLRFGAVFVRKENLGISELSVLSGGRSDTELQKCELDRIDSLFEEIRSLYLCQTALTDKELDVLHLLAEGYSQSIVAETLQVSREAVKRRIATARFKLGASNTTEAVARAVANKLISPSSDPNG